jgi:hypothetical protein
MNTFRVSGTITGGDGKPLAQARVRFISDLKTLGTTPAAAVSMRTAITWTRRVTGFDGHRWNAYTKYVANNVAGITFAEFKEQVVAKNPSLEETGSIFQSNQTYVFPQNIAGAVELKDDG